MAGLTRRKLIAGSALTAGAALPVLAGRHGGTAAAAQHDGHGGHGGKPPPAQGGHGGGHAAFQGGAVDHAANGFDPAELVRDFDGGKTSRLPNGQMLREWTLIAGEKEIEVAPGVKYVAWAYNGRVPGPTLRATEGDRMRVTFINGSQHPHTIHFHGIHPAEMDGVPGVGAGMIAPGDRTVYEFDAEPFGLHLYHCHVRPLAEHIAKGLYGAFIVDPPEERAQADELVMVMNGFDTNFDRANEVYAANTVGFAYMDPPLRVKRGELIRIYLVNALEFDLINSFHVHANFFHYYPTGTSLEPTELTDTMMLCQGQRGILEMRFREPGRFMYHAHQSEFTELGWQGFFEVVE